MYKEVESAPLVSETIEDDKSSPVCPARVRPSISSCVGGMLELNLSAEDERLVQIKREHDLAKAVK